MKRQRTREIASYSFTYVDVMMHWYLAETSVWGSCTKFITSRQEMAGLRKMLLLPISVSFRSFKKLVFSSAVTSSCACS